jgi:hypothetical protein
VRQHSDREQRGNQLIVESLRSHDLNAGLCRRSRLSKNDRLCVRPLVTASCSRRLEKKGRDGYENFLATLLDRRIGRAAVAHVAVTFDIVDGHDVCRIDVKRSPQPVFVSNYNGDADLYVRLNNSTRLPNTADALKYVRAALAIGAEDDIRRADDHT